MKKSTIIKRFLISILLGLLSGLVMSEVGFYVFGRTSRPPKDITLIIPSGTAKLVAQGQEPPAIPQDLTFVVGDTLVVKNEDTTSHQLGPLWIPPSTEGRLKLGSAENLAFQCSFLASNYLNLDIRQPLTIGTRITGVLFGGLPFGMLIAVYSVLLPVKKKKKDALPENAKP